MRTRKKALILLLALSLAVTLCACGGGSGSTADVSNKPPPSVNWQDDTEPPDDSDYSGSDAPSQPLSEEPTEPEGLIIVERDRDTPTAGQLMCTIHGLNPETGEERVISNFIYQDTREIDGCSFTEWLFPLQCRRNFSSDYSKMVLTKVFVNRANGQESHAGWIDANGNFFDVTEALGLLTNNDSDIPVFYSLWFWDDWFEYMQIKDGTDILDCFIPIDNFTQDAILEMDFRSNNYPYPYNEYDVTSWIDSTHCIVNIDNYGVIQSLILDTETQTTSNYIPDSFYESWNGVSSPDGTQIAFMARPEGGGGADIYIIPAGGGSPTKVSGHSFALQNASYNIYNNGWGGTYTLVDWQ